MHVPRSAYENVSMHLCFLHPLCLYSISSLYTISSLCVYAELAAAEMQLLRQALDKLQSETRVLDDELARAREQAIFSEFEHAELSHELEIVSAQLQASQASKAELEDTISKVGLKQRQLTTQCMCVCKCMFVCKHVDFANACFCANAFAAGRPCKPPGFNLGFDLSYKQLSHMCAAAVSSLIAPT